jgi:hypothetical protein
MSLLEIVLRASGGLDLWRRMQRYTLHLSIGGALCQRKYSAACLKELVVVGATHEQTLEIVGFTGSDRRALYGADWVALEGPDGRRIKERHASPREFRSELAAPVWDELLLAYFCGYLVWNYVSVPFVLAEPDFVAEELEPVVEHTEPYGRLQVAFPARVVTHATEQIFSFDRGGHLRQLDYAADFENRAVTQLFSGHQRFSGILVPTLCRMLGTAPHGASTATPPLIDVEVFDAVFE